MKKRGLPMRLQFFADGGDVGDTANSDMDDLDNLLSGMNADADDGGDDATQDPPAQQNEPDDQAQTPKPNKTNKANHAFAEMRTQNAQLLGLLTKVATAAGIEFENNKDLISKLNDDTLNKLAQKQNVPVELLKRMEELEQIGRLHTASQLRDTALIGFQNIKNDYALTDEELQAFAAELDADGKNPFLVQVDLEAEYRLRHFQDILRKETQKAVEEALKKSNAADRHSSTPSNKQGKPDSGGEEKINTVSGLNALLKEM